MSRYPRRRYVTTAQLERNLAEVEEHARIRAEREQAANIAANVHLDSATPVTDALKEAARRELEEVSKLLQDAENML